MRNVNLTVLSANDNQTTNGTVIDANQLVSASFQAYFGDSQAAGTFKLQASNDPYNARYNYPEGTFAPTHWVDIPNQSAAVTTGTSALLTIANSAYRWLRAVYTTTAAGVQTIAPIADTGVKQAQTVSTVADTGAFEISTITAVADVAGSLNNTYFTFSAKDSGGLTATDYYLWLDNGTGVDPALPGRTAIPVVYADNDTDATIAGLCRTQVTAVAGAKVVVTGATNQVIITDKFMGNVTNAADGAAPTGFNFVIQSGAASNLLNKYFTLSSINLVTKVQKNFYLWLNVNSEGSDPLVPSKTAIPVALASLDSANTVATAIRAALNALTNDFVATGGTNAVIITDVAAGPVTAAVDGAAATGFSFGAATAGVASNLINKYFYLQDTNNANTYFVWMNPDSIGTAPVVSGRTAVPIVYSSGASAGTIGTAMASAIAALNGTASFSATGTTTVTVTNLVAGPFVPMTDVGLTGFAFAVTGGGNSTVTVNMNALSV